MHQRFLGKHCLITGAAGGIGFAIAHHLLKEGARVSLLDINDQTLQNQATKLIDTFDNPIHLCPAVDISDHSTVRHQIKTLVKEQGPIDALVHAAATLTASPLLEMEAADFERMIQVNIQGCFNLLQAISRAMVDRKQGSIVVIGSNSATVPRLDIGAYGATKASIHMLVKNFALELSRYGIRCNLVSPGSTRTDMLIKTWREDYGEAETISGDLDNSRLGIPLNKIAEPQDIAKAVAFLLSEDAGHITMHDLRVDGGATLNQMG